jgi:hypothetical protein
MEFLTSYKYYIEFNTNILPLNFNEYISIDIEKELYKQIFNSTCCLKMNELGFLYLNDFLEIVIESSDDLILQVGGINFTLKKGIYYIPFFVKYHAYFIKKSDGLKMYHCNNSSDFLRKFLPNHKVIFKNIINIDSNDVLICMNSMAGFTPYNNIDKTFKESSSEFYFEYEKSNDSTNNEHISENIHCIDNYVQNDFIKIYKYN